MLAYESAVIGSQAEASITKWIERSQIERATIELMEMVAALARLDEPEGLSEVADLTFLVNFIRERWSDSGESVLGEAIETRIEGDRLISTFSPEAIQDLINFAHEQGQLSEDDLRAQFKEYLGQQIHRTEKLLETDDHQLERRRGLASLPDDAELNRILKYQSRTDRGLYKSLHELQRLQAGRQGEHLLLPAAVDVTVDVDALILDNTLEAAVAAMDDEKQVVGEAPERQLGAVEVGQLSQTPSKSRSTNKHSAEASDSPQSSAREEESISADEKPESQQRSLEDWRRLITPKRKGTPIKDYLVDTEVARFLAQHNAGEARDGDRGEPPSAG